VTDLTSSARKDFKKTIGDDSRKTDLNESKKNGGKEEVSGISFPPTGNENDRRNSSNDCVADHDLETPYFQSLSFRGSSQMLLGPSAHKHKQQEPLRAGDIIQYTHPMYVAGSKQGLRLTQVLNVKLPTRRHSKDNQCCDEDDDDEYILELVNGELLPSSTRIKRVREFVPETQKLYNHEGGIYRPVHNFRLIPGALPQPEGCHNYTSMDRQIQHIEASLEEGERQCDGIIKSIFRQQSTFASCSQDLRDTDESDKEDSYVVQQNPSDFSASSKTNPAGKDLPENASSGQSNYSNRKNIPSGKDAPVTGPDPSCNIFRPSFRFRKRNQQFTMSANVRCRLSESKHDSGAREVLHRDNQDDSPHQSDRRTGRIPGRHQNLSSVDTPNSCSDFSSLSKVEVSQPRTMRNEKKRKSAIRRKRKNPQQKPAKRASKNPPEDVFDFCGSQGYAAPPSAGASSSATQGLRRTPIPLRDVTWDKTLSSKTRTRDLSSGDETTSPGLALLIATSETEASPMGPVFVDNTIASHEAPRLGYNNGSVSAAVRKYPRTSGASFESSQSTKEPGAPQNHREPDEVDSVSSVEPPYSSGSNTTDGERERHLSTSDVQAVSSSARKRRKDTEDVKALPTPKRRPVGIQRDSDLFTPSRRRPRQRNESSSSSGEGKSSRSGMRVKEEMERRLLRANNVLALSSQANKPFTLTRHKEANAISSTVAPTTGKKPGKKMWW